MKNIYQYIRKRQLSLTKPIDEQKLLLGVKPHRIIYFFTFKQIYKEKNSILELLNKQLYKFRSKLIINGNLNDKMILKLINVSEKYKKNFSIVVYDGYKSFLNYNMSDSSDVAIIVENQGD